MNYNKFSRPKMYSLNPINSRAKLDTGTQCNYKCGFCYYINDLDKVTSLDTITNRIDTIYESDMKEIDLSGGESTIHKDWFSILDYCAERFISVSCLSNGSKLKDYDFAEKSYEYGLKEVLFSLHGYDEKSHDQIVQHKNAFKNMLQAIQNCNILGIKVRINCTVTSKNAKNMFDYAQLINSLDVKQVNLLPLNYWEDATEVKPESYEVLSQGIKTAIDFLDLDIQVNVRYIPYCFMEGYEEYVVGIYQHIFDLNDWNIMMYPGHKLEDPDIEDYYDTAHEKRNHTYMKPKECFECKYFQICDGIEKELKDQKVYPVEGEQIQSPMNFRKNHARI